MRKTVVLITLFFAVTCNIQAQTDSIDMYLEQAPKDPVQEEVYTFAEQMPEFPGGNVAMDKFIKKEINYPGEAVKAKITGRVIGQFVVEKDGSITNIKVLKGVDPLLDAEFIRVVKAMPLWIPGKQNGNPVRIRYTLPVVFKL